MASARKSIRSTYNHRDTGDRFTVETRIDGKRNARATVPDPFVNTTVYVRWRDLLRGLFRRGLQVSVHVSGGHDICEDVMELNDDYLGEQGSSRRKAWDAQLEGSLRDFSALAGEHDVS